MNFSQSSSIKTENDCKSFFFQTVPLKKSSTDSFYDLLVTAAVFSLAASSLTIFLNALVMVVVKTKQRLQTPPNILLACLALTDLMVGLVVQPLHLTKTILLIQGKDFHEFCQINLAFTMSFVIFFFASLFHLVLISGERYLAIKHTFTHTNVVTKARLLISSAVAWIAAVIYLLVASYSMVVALVFKAATFSSIVLLHTLVYKEGLRSFRSMVRSFQVTSFQRKVISFHKKVISFHDMVSSFHDIVRSFHFKKNRLCKELNLLTR